MGRMQTGLGLIVVAFLAFAVTAEAAKKNKRSGMKPVDPSDVFEVQVNIGTGKKQKTEKVMCLSKIPGLTKTKKSKLMFQSYAALLKKLRESAAPPAKVGRVQKLLKAGKRACGTQDMNSIEEYTGPFGAEQVRTLYDRFAFGATEEDVNYGVANGLDATVRRLFSLTDTAGLDAEEKDLRCDGRLSYDPENEQCDPTYPNDVYSHGVRMGLFYRFMKSPNPFYEKLFMVLHDRIAASGEALWWCDQYGLPEHVDRLRRHAIDGDYKTLMREMISDVLMLHWLDGANNRAGSPNENFAREFWELFTVGTANLDGVPNYNNTDIKEAARAFTGWSIEGYQFDEDRWICYQGYVPGLHDPYTKTIFQGTPFQRNVQSGEDVLEASFAHPGTAEDLAEHFWKEYVNPEPSRAVITRLAAMLREDNYNIHRMLRTMMKSSALYAERSRKSLIKDPVDLLFGFLRTTGIPTNFYWELGHSLEDMGQMPTLPPTVFGWNPYQLAGEGYVVEAKNALIRILRADWVFEEEGFTFYKFLHENMSSGEVIDKLSGMLNVRLNETQKQHLDQFMNFDINWRGELERVQFDSHPDASDIWWKKTGNLLYLLAGSPEYRMK